MVRNKLEVLRWGVVNPSPNPQAGGPPPVGRPLLLIQYIRSYPPYLEVVSEDVPRRGDSGPTQHGYMAHASTYMCKNVALVDSSMFLFKLVLNI
jgi:hypothetical protein